MRELRCGAIVPGCDWVGRAETEAELLHKAADHARTAHGIERMTPEMRERVRGAITDAGGDAKAGSKAGAKRKKAG